MEKTVCHKVAHPASIARFSLFSTIKNVFLKPLILQSQIAWFLVGGYDVAIGYQRPFIPATQEDARNKSHNLLVF
ncbi:MAG: hypothetical protein HY751_05825 [Nitrospinae bacterium]|nr:hypothetical protein [Nitrospinota bacterium]